MLERIGREKVEEKLSSCPQETIGALALAMGNYYEEIFELAPYDNAIYIWKNSLHPETEGRTMPYTDYFWEFVDEVVYPYDSENYKKQFELENIKRFLYSQEQSFSVQVRFRGKYGGGRWVEAFVLRSPLDARKVTLLIREIQREKINHIVYKAAVSDYDYVICIDVLQKTYNIYSCKDELFGDSRRYNRDYEADMIASAYNTFVSEDINSIITSMGIQSIIDCLSRQEEYIVYVTLEENGRIHHKKHRYIFWDKTRTKILVTRVDVTEQIEQERQQRQQLQFAYQEVDKASKAKSEFISQMSHDIRTPLNAIMGMTMIAGTHVDDREKVISSLNNIVYSGKHLLTLVNEVLDMSRLESGRIHLEEIPFSMKELLVQLTDMVKGLTLEHNHILITDFSQVVHNELRGDVNHIKQIFLNLIGNSIKYTPEGGEIFFQMRETEEIEGRCRYEMLIRDTGIGMSREFLQHIFEPFSRAEDTRTNKVAGTGLGMTIARNLIHLMGGEIHIDSRQGEGTCFQVTLFFALDCDKKNN